MKPSEQLAERSRGYVPWFGLLCVWAAFVIALTMMHPANLFGLTEDDSIYFSSAKALAEGKGYILPNFPGMPAATKYPELYPWILSWVWHWKPRFPANLHDAIAVTVVFGLLYITMAFVFLRELRFSDPEALMLTAFCALHPRVLFYSGCLLTDIPFAALALASLVLAQKSMKREAITVEVAGSGFLAGLSMLMRLLGSPLAVGIGLAYAFRRSWRQLGVFCASMLPFFVLIVSRLIYSRAPVSPVSGPSAAFPGWIQTWAYYSSYINDWRQGVPNASVLRSLLAHNLIWLFRAPAEYFISPLPAKATASIAILIALVTVLIFKGMIRCSNDSGLRPIFSALCLYSFAIVLWNYPYATRFLIPFLPLFVAGLWTEGSALFKTMRVTRTAPGSLSEKSAFYALAIAMIVLATVIFGDYIGGMRERYIQTSAQRGAILREKQEAYNWLARSTKSNARVLAYEDASFYLYSGRVAVRPLTFPTNAAYDPQVLKNVLEHTTDVARAIGADYWVVSDDDYVFEWRDGYLGYKARIRELEKVLPVVFTSQFGGVKIYSLKCIQDSSCPFAEAMSDGPRE